MKLDGIDLNLLRVFEALDETRSVSGAAERLGIGQPAASAALGRLRTAFGDPLFVRAGGAMQPTPRAARLAPRLRAVLADLREAVGEAAAFDPATAQTRFRLAFTDYASAVLGPPLMARIRAAAPSAALDIVGYEKGDVGALVAAGAVDAAVGVFPDPPPDAVVTTLFEERFVGLARAGHPALGRPLDAAGWAGLDHALVTLGRDRRGALDAALAALGLSRRVALTLPHFLALPAILGASDLVAALPERLAAIFCDAALETFAIPLPLGAWRVQSMWPASARTDRPSVWLRARLAEAAEAVGGGR